MKSICIKISAIGSDGWKRKIQWDSRARRTIADFLGLTELNELVADIEIAKSRSVPNVFILKGNFEASFVQECVICMGLVGGGLKEDILAKFVPIGLELKKEDIFTYLDEDHPETYSDDMLEIGKLVQDQLSLAVPAYPRHSQSSCVSLVEAGGYVGKSSKNSPFAGLGKLLNKNNKDPIE